MEEEEGVGAASHYDQNEVENLGMFLQNQHILNA